MVVAVASVCLVVFLTVCLVVPGSSDAWRCLELEQIGAEVLAL